MTDILRLAKKPRRGKCRVSVNGMNCQRKVSWRGLCQKHRLILKEEGRFDEFALPLPYRRFDDDDFEVNPSHKKGCCRVIEKGIVCKTKTQNRGLCKQHYDILRNNKVVDKYALPSRNVKHYELNLNHEPGECRISENGIPCGRKVHGRGLCTSHHTYCNRNKLLEVFGTPSKQGYFEGNYRKDKKKKKWQRRS